MRAPRLIKALFIIAVTLTLLLLHSESPRCESQPAALNSAQSQVKGNNLKVAEKAGDSEVQDEKSNRFKIMEWMIRQNLMQQYSQLAASEDLEDNLD